MLPTILGAVIVDAYELDRVKKDLQTIKQAIGFELPFGWDSVWLNMFGIPCIGAYCLVYWLITESPSRYAPVVPTVFLLLLLGYLRFRYRHSTRRSPTERREYGAQFYTTVFLVVVSAGFRTWAELAGIDTVYVGSGLVTMLGMAITLNGIFRRVYRSALGGGIPCTLFGISMADWPDPGAVILNASILCFMAGPAMASIQVYQLKGCGVNE